MTSDRIYICGGKNSEILHFVCPVEVKVDTFTFASLHLHLKVKIAYLLSISDRPICYNAVYFNSIIHRLYLWQFITVGSKSKVLIFHIQNQDFFTCRGFRWTLHVNFFSTRDE